MNYASEGFRLPVGDEMKVAAERQYRDMTQAVGGCVGTTSDAPPRHKGPFHIAGEMFIAMAELHNRLEALAERLAGPEPANQAKEGIRSPPAGIFGALETEVHIAQGRIAGMHSALSRIERNLT